MFDVDSVMTLDPTLLFTVSFYNKLIESQPVALKQNYLLSYNLMSNKSQTECAITYAKDRNLTYVGMHDIAFKTAGPLDFLSLIKNAKYIFQVRFMEQFFQSYFIKNSCVFYLEMNVMNEFCPCWKH